MKPRLLTKAFATLSTALLLAGAAHAAAYVTNFTGVDTGSFPVSRIEVMWDTNVALNNPVTAADLSDLSFAFYDDSNALVYIDNTIIGGVVQPIGGVARTLADLAFDATSGVSIQGMDNDLNQVQFGAASGATYNFYGDATIINLAAYMNGTLSEDATFAVTGQNTSAIPEPSSYAALAGLAGLGLAAARRKRA